MHVQCVRVCVCVCIYINTVCTQTHTHTHILDISEESKRTSSETDHMTVRRLYACLVL